MKQLVYFIYLSLLAVILISCQKEQVVPAAAADAASFAENAKSVSCQTYSYQTKTGTVQLGTVATDKILVIFNSSLTLAQKNQILRSFKKIDQIIYENLVDTGDLITAVALKNNTTCADVEAMMQTLLANNNVLMVLPTFGSAANGTKTEFINGILVQMKNPNSAAAINQLVQSSNTQIAGYPSAYGPGLYYIRVDKYANGSFFDIISFFNASAKVEFAEPDGPITPLRKSKFRLQPALQASAN